LFQGADFSRTRPYTPSRQPLDYIQAAREEGPSLVQAFHESMARQGGQLNAVIADVCAFANTNGGTIYIGLSADPKKAPVGVPNPQETIKTLQQEISRAITPTLPCQIDTQETSGKTIIRVQVPAGDDWPYAIDDNKIYLRDETDTMLAVRDEIVSLVLRGAAHKEAAPASEPAPIPLPQPVVARDITTETPATPPIVETTEPPRAGVEIIDVEQRGGEKYFTMRDLRNGNIVKNVTRSSARRLWHYAIKQHESNPVRPDKVEWHGDIGLWTRGERAGEMRYDLVQREDGKIRVYYGVTDSGMHGPWQAFLAPEEEGNPT